MLGKHRLILVDEAARAEVVDYPKKTGIIVHYSFNLT